ncbi:MAG TPA: tetratricopeptide repeat protein [Candidatus Aquilonibacter sp.]|nr:tetratricopeptide repeat protein [Candidatus Aquilonibacter sp.]
MKRHPNWRAAILFGVCLSTAACPPSRAGRTAADGPAISEAQHQFDAGNYSAVISALQPVVSQNPSDGAAYYWLGRSYYELRDYDNAVASAEKSVAIDPKNSLYHQRLGQAYGGKADVDRSFSMARKVKKEFETAVSLDPSNIQARRDLEEFCLEAPWIVGGSKDEAMQQVDAIAATDPVQGHLARAVYFHDAKENDQAENEYKQVLAAKPQKPDPYFEVADFYFEQSQPAGIETAVQAAAAVSPTDPRILFYRGVEGVIANQNLPDAERNLKAYLATSPDRSDWPAHASARVWLGRLYELQGKTTDAVEQYRAALQLNPRRKDARERLQKLGASSQ